MADTIANFALNTRTGADLPATSGTAVATVGVVSFMPLFPFSGTEGGKARSGATARDSVRTCYLSLGAITPDGATTNAGVRKGVCRDRFLAVVFSISTATLDHLFAHCHYKAGQANCTIHYHHVGVVFYRGQVQHVKEGSFTVGRRHTPVNASDNGLGVVDCRGGHCSIQFGLLRCVRGQKL